MVKAFKDFSRGYLATLVLLVAAPRQAAKELQVNVADDVAMMLILIYLI